ncbi:MULTISPECIES: OB-fold-containig protein [unclassified Aureispira]|uniref:OB-fold-containig protein n=1 Tax=unclassified Aureispira TaxID=2649989 RepID=UPI000698523D|nr:MULTISPECIES: OB-fold-containig protein [unclassified Aureispira]WMX17419.1 DUF1449 family protein [Aureispira sp. CCB-E]
MGELITAAFSTSNLFLTLLLGLVTLYWLSVIVGAIGMDSLDFDLDLDADIDVDVDVDVDADIAADVDADADTDTTSVGSAGGGSLFLGTLRFFNFGRVPFMVLLSTIILCLWSISIYCNHDASWINPGNSTSMAAVLFFPNLIISLLFSKLLTAPLVPIFAKLNTAEKALVIDGKVGTLMTSIKEEETGQLKIDINGSIVSLSVQSNDGKAIQKGEKVVVIEKMDNGKAYIVQKIEHH